MNHAAANDNSLHLDLIGGLDGYLILYRGRTIARASTLSSAARLMAKIKHEMGWSK